MSLAEIDGSEAVPSWSAHETLPDVWEHSGWAHEGGSTDRLMLFRDDALMDRVEGAASDLTIENQYVDRNILDDGSGDWLLQVYSATDPTTSIRATKRRRAIAVGNDCHISDIHVRRAIGNNGPLVAGLNADIQRVLGSEGTKHVALIESGSITDSIFTRIDTGTSYEPGNSLLVGYAIDADGLEYEVTRVGLVGDGFGGAGYLSHDSTGNPSAITTKTQCWDTDLSSGWGPASLIVRNSGHYSKNALRPFDIYSDDCIIECAQIHQADDGLNSFHRLLTTSGASLAKYEHCVFFSGGSATALFVPTSAFDTGTLEFDSVVFFATASRQFVAPSTWAEGTLKINNSILCSPYDVVPIGVPSGVSYEGDRNVFLCDSDEKDNLNLAYHGATYDTLAAWQAATGQDANSIALGPSDLASLFAGTVADGDFRLGGSGAGAAVAALSAGPQQHWDWNARAAASGPPTVWPDVPETLAEAETYVLRPQDWTF